MKIQIKLNVATLRDDQRRIYICRQSLLDVLTEAAIAKLDTENTLSVLVQVIKGAENDD